jgi:cell division protein FtsQ
VATRRTPTPARAAVIPLPGSVNARVAVRRLVPTGRSLLVGLGLLLAAAGLYLLARETSVFAVREVRVVGAPPGIAREVAEVAAREKGTSLMRVDSAALLKEIRALPDVAGVRYDRAFPHTLRLTVKPERPVAVLRRGAESWVVSMRGRIIRSVPAHTRKALPRIWLSPRVHPEPGTFLHDRLAVRAVATLNPLVRTPLPARIANVTTAKGQLTLVTRTHVEIVLGSIADLPLKLELVRKILPGLRAPSGGVAYLDVSVPEWAVTGTRTLNSQVQVDTSSSVQAGMSH